MMKALKAAAVLAGSIAIAGSAAPAFAGDLTPTRLTSEVESLATQPLLDPKPGDTNLIDTKKGASVVNTVSDAAGRMNTTGGPTKLIGGLPAAS
ncbi:MULTISPECIES: hypothetical protein [unclassified Streptomyces]|jgi:hypothetical protein|uniref:hypothetical protein n=1 Tax=Streptomyces TaxID=1883 RepID=UPI002A75F089|nr:hypothetical protein [Streptomyces sp. KN37]WPO72408.1 hypothetical protein R9806_18100 [Streptomyces sp. KN37]